MTTRNLLALALLAGTAVPALADNAITVAGHAYPTAFEYRIGGQPVRMALTGAAARTKYFLTIYTVGSYVQQGTAVRAPEDLAAADGPKQLLLIMSRAVRGADMAAATEQAIRANYPAPQFTDEVALLREHFARADIQAGARVWLTHVPGVGLSVQQEGAAEVVIRNPRFSRAVWDIYVGPNNLGADIKNGLISR